MATRTPGWSGDLGTITGYDDHEAWSGWADQWPGTAATAPAQVPDAVEWEMPFRPGDVEGAYGRYTDWASGAGQDPLPLDRFNDAQYIQAHGALPDAPGAADPQPLQDLGYTLHLDAPSTAMTDWRLNYDIMQEGRKTGYDLMTRNPYGAFPWVADPDIPAPPRPGDNRPTTGEFSDTGLPTIRGDDGPALGAGTDLEDPWYGDIREDVSTTDYPYSIPQQQGIGMLQVGDDPLSEFVNAALGGTISTGGLSPNPFAGQTQGALSSIMDRGGQGAEIGSQLEWDTQNALRDLIANAGQLPADAQRRAMEMETLRNPIEAFRQAQLSQGQAELARRGLLGQGPELDYMSRLEGQLGEQYATAGQQLALAEQERADQRYRDALAQGADLGMAQSQRREDRLSSTLQLATGMTEEMTRNLLATAQTWTERQQMLSDVALRNLDQNIEWNKFLAEQGLERDQVIEAIQTGRLSALLPIMQTFLQQVQTAAQGYIPYYDEDQDRAGRAQTVTTSGNTTTTRRGGRPGL